MDVDGTLTDGGIYIGEGGEVMKRFNVKDGYAISNMLPIMGIIPAIITGRKSSIVENRCKELGIKHLIQGSTDKLKDLERLCVEQRVSIFEVGYIGDDLNDFEVMSKVGFKACPANAAGEIKNICDYISAKDGGEGAVRDVITFLLRMAD